ncbi:MAG: efflux RND transporter periplasmic adaptor subunit [Hyphomicrobiales bacterium]
MPDGSELTRISAEEVRHALGVGRRRRGWLSRLAWLLALLALAGLGAGLWWYETRNAPTQNYVTEPVHRQALTVEATATGTIQPVNQVDVSSELSGIMRTVHVDYNARVKKGQPLAELDTDRLRAQVDRGRASLVVAEADVATAEATIAERKRDLDRAKRLSGTGIASEQTLETAQAAYDRAVAALDSTHAAVKVAVANLKLQETDLEKAVILSPIDGVVLKRSVEPGQTVASSFQAPVLFTLADDLSHMQVEVDVDEADVGQVAEGQKATFTVDAYPDRVFPAVVEQVRYAPQTVEGVVTYKAILKVDNSDLKLRPGMTATALITVNHIEDALTVPNAALRFRPPDEDGTPKRSFLRSLMPGPPSFRPPSKKADTSGKRSVYVLKDGKPQKIDVVVGPSDGKVTAIKTGDLQDGDQAITGIATPETGATP